MQANHPFALPPPYLPHRGQSLGSIYANHAKPHVSESLPSLFSTIHTARPMELSRIQSAPAPPNHYQHHHHQRISLLHQGVGLDVFRLSREQISQEFRRLIELTTVYEQFQRQEKEKDHQGSNENQTATRGIQTRHSCTEDEARCVMACRGDWWMCLVAGDVHYCTTNSCSFYCPVGEHDGQSHCAISGVMHGHDELMDPYQYDSVDQSTRERTQHSDDLRRRGQYYTASDLSTVYRQELAKMNNPYIQPWMSEAKLLRKEVGHSLKKPLLQRMGQVVTLQPIDVALGIQFTNEGDLIKQWTVMAWDYIKAALDLPLEKKFIDWSRKEESTDLSFLARHCATVWSGILQTPKFVSGSLASKKRTTTTTTAKKEEYTLLCHTLVMLNDIHQGGRAVPCYTDIDQPPIMYQLYSPHPGITSIPNFPTFSDFVVRFKEKRSYTLMRKDYNQAIKIHQACIPEYVRLQVEREAAECVVARPRKERKLV